MTAWIELAQMDGVIPYYVFRGSFPSGRRVAWATRHLRVQIGTIDLGPTDGRMALPSGITEGIPDAHGAPPERVSVTIDLDNTDGALSSLMVGGPNPRSEYSGDSFSNLAGSLSIGLVAPDGEIREQTVTPTLCLAGDPTSSGGKIQLPLATRDEALLGRTKKIVTVKQLAAAEWVADGTTRRGDGVGQVFSRADWDAVRGNLKANLDTVIPFAYGRNAFPLTVATDESTRGKHVLLGWLSTTPPVLTDAHLWEFCTDKYERRKSAEFFPSVGAKWVVFSVKVRVTLADLDRTKIEVWLTGVTLSSVSGAINDFLSGDHFAIPSTAAKVGIGQGAVDAVPAHVIRRIIEDHSELGTLARDLPSFFRAAAATGADAGVVGGTYGSDASIADIISHVAQVGYGLWVAPDNKVHILAHSAWSQDEQTAATEGNVPTIWLSDVGRASWTETLPVADGHRGAAATRVSVRYSAEQNSFWPAEFRRDRAPGAHRVSLAQEVEARISGEWIYPPMVDRALVGVSSRRAFPTRRFSLIAPLWVMALDLGSLVRITHPLGVGEGGYYLRLGRLERKEHMPGEMAVQIQIEDLGPVEHIRPGKLDSMVHWIAATPAPGLRLILKAGDPVVQTLADVFTEEMTGGSIWAFGSLVDGNRQSFEIVKVIDGKTIEVNPKPAADESIFGSPAGTEPIDAAWIVMHTHQSKGPDFRPEYIRLANEETGLLPDGTPGYQLME